MKRLLSLPFLLSISIFANPTDCNEKFEDLVNRLAGKKLKGFDQHEFNALMEIWVKTQAKIEPDHAAFVHLTDDQQAYQKTVRELREAEESLLSQTKKIQALQSKKVREGLGNEESRKLEELLEARNRFAEETAEPLRERKANMEAQSSEDPAYIGRYVSTPQSREENTATYRQFVRKMHKFRVTQDALENGERKIKDLIKRMLEKEARISELERAKADRAEINSVKAELTLLLKERSDLKEDYLRQLLNDMTNPKVFPGQWYSK